MMEQVTCAVSMLECRLKLTYILEPCKQTRLHKEIIKNNFGFMAKY